MPTLVHQLVQSIRRHRAASIAVLVALLVVGFGLALGLQRAAGDARADVGPERHRGSLARLELGVARFELSAAQGEQIGAAAQRDEAQHQVAALQEQLQRVQQLLASTTDLVTLQGPQIEALDRCLNGVSSALDQVSVADAGASRTLQATQLLCRDAQAAISATPPG
ncbi:MAG TPA: hypothetical protein VKH36_13350 [Acidimicrobiia bacterium]|nr:hypothetical protein [Acidimicrobiia bacterium]